MKNSLRQTVIVLCALAIVGAAFFQVYALALIVGVVAGAFLLITGMANGGSIGNARKVGQGPADHSTRIGVSLAAAGIAGSSLGQSHFPVSFRVFYGVCLVAGCIIAVVLAFRSAPK